MWLENDRRTVCTRGCSVAPDHSDARARAALEWRSNTGGSESSVVLDTCHEFGPELPRPLTCSGRRTDAPTVLRSLDRHGGLGGEPDGTRPDRQACWHRHHWLP